MMNSMMPVRGTPHPQFLSPLEKGGEDKSNSQKIARKNVA